MKLLCKSCFSCSVQHMTKEILRGCTWCAEKTKAQALVKLLNFTFCCGRGLSRVTTFYPSVSAKLWKVERSPRCISLCLGRGSVFGWISFSSLAPPHTLTPLIFFFMPPSLTMYLLVLLDPSCSKQAVTSACSLWRKRGQNLNIDSMQCETKIPVSLVFLFF